MDRKQTDGCRSLTLADTYACWQEKLSYSEIHCFAIWSTRLKLLDIFVNDTTGDFVGRTGRPWWAAAATRGAHVELQPIQILQRRGVLVTTLRHELAHAVIDSVGRGRAPRWLAEGMALFFAGEGPLIARYTPRARMTVDQIDRKLGRAGAADEMRAAYAAAYREVSNLIRTEGESSLWRRVVGG